MTIKPSFESKLDRAEQHLQELQAEIERWIKSHPYRITDELDPKTDDNIICGQLLGPTPPLILQLVGDCLQNLRSCLDHLAYALALANKESLTDAEVSRIAFPIFRYGAFFETRGLSKIRFLSRRAQAVIKRLQPCYTKHPTSHLLWHLETLNNIDKHRRLLISVVTLIGAGVRHAPGTQMEFFTWSGDGVFREAKTELARYRCVNPKDGNRVKVVEFRPTPIVIFGDIQAEDRIVHILLDEIARWIRSVIFPTFRRLL